MKFRVYWSNFGYFSQEEFDALEDARKYGVSKCFDHSIHYGDTILGWWSVIGGWRTNA